MEISGKTMLSGFQKFFTETFGLGKGVSIGTILLIGLVTACAVFWFFYSAPPDTITMMSGPQGTLFHKTAERYAKILARDGVKLKIIPSDGSRDNLKKLSDHKFRIDVGFVQGGIAKGQNVERLLSLGSIAYEPLFVFYRATAPLELLSQLKGKRIAIGDEGSGTHALALTLLASNGIEPGGTTAILNLEADDAAKALTEGKVDAAFMMGDSASSRLLRDLLRQEKIRLFDFTQADGYTRRFPYLSKLILPKGAMDFGKNIPSNDVQLIAPTVELIARSDLHPALSDLLLSAATEVHGRATLLQGRGEFPVPLENEYRISADANRFYKSGKSFLYRYLPFWMASLVNRILVVIVPLIVILIPGLRIIPILYAWRMKMRIYRWYAALLVLERDLATQVRTDKRASFLERLDEIEDAVHKMKVPSSFADQFYGLLVHIDFVRGRLMSDKPLC